MCGALLDYGLIFSVIDALLGTGLLRKIDALLDHGFNFSMMTRLIVMDYFVILARFSSLDFLNWSDALVHLGLG